MVKVKKYTKKLKGKIISVKAHNRSSTKSIKSMNTYIDSAITETKHELLSLRANILNYRDIDDTEKIALVNIVDDTLSNLEKGTKKSYLEGRKELTQLDKWLKTKHPDFKQYQSNIRKAGSNLYFLERGMSYKRRKAIKHETQDLAEKLKLDRRKK